ncbi:MAG: hypothetical protein IKT41_01290, partial [Clostridia bacterium]|nr:hypothetical protein [Clostridia bacterium]
LGAIENNSVISTGNRNYRTFTLDEDCYCRFVLLPRTGSSITNLSIDNLSNYKPQIEIGDTPTECVPYGKYKIPVKVSDELGNSIVTNIYLNEPLRKRGNYVDYIDFGKQKEFRNVVVLDDTGTLTIEESYKGVIDNVGTKIELPNTPTFKGTTTIEIDTTIQPSNMEVQYYGKGGVVGE